MRIHQDNSIVKQLRFGDRHSQDHVLTKIYRENYRMIEKYILDNSGTEDQVQDIFQEGIIAFYNQCKKDEFILHSSLGTYLYAICRNIWLRRLNREKRMVELKENSYSSENTTREGLERQEKNKALSKIIHRLGDNCQRILALFYFEKHPMRSIANNMGFANKDVAKSKKYKCLQKLKTMVLASAGIMTLLR